MSVKIKQIAIPKDKRVICISDIHGNLELLERLLIKTGYSSDDTLLLLGDLFAKGPQPHETLKFIITLCQNPNVYVLRGNGDLPKDYMSESEKEWLAALPHILEAENYIFVHGGIGYGNLMAQREKTCMKNYAFMEKGLKFDKYIVTGHWPTINYAHKIPCYNPIVDKASRIISIDGGAVVKNGGQLNAFFIANNVFSFTYVDSFPTYQAEKPQAEKGGSLNTTWLDRFVELVEEGEEFSLFRHTQSGQVLPLPNSAVWQDQNGRVCECTFGTDYYLPVNAGDTVSVVKKFSDRIYAKKDGVGGWLAL